ncbi:uncharacterized protein LOC143179739 isoform X2 [Calliopsis andreniformis]|uniref:uncharacterized protein LOC143179739 isoform X2 n=1 Tax=Calliopsis andreniformis TaxID=337506 RepID=UPI003FCE3D34
MVRLRKPLQDGDVYPQAETNYLTVSRNSRFKGYRRQHSVRLRALKKMLTPRRSGPISPEEIGNGHETKDPGSTGNGSVTPGTFENGDGTKEFLSTGRTGRRNALPDIMGCHAETGLLDLPDRFEELSTATDQSSSGQDPNLPSTSKQG